MENKALYVDKLLIFDIKGHMAHFRKFYTNSSSLSYFFPPRTTITGLIAGLLGRERNKYYEEFSSEKCKIAVSIRVPIRKIMQTVNYVRTKSLGELNLSGGHTQVPLEIALPSSNFNEIVYRIYFYHSGETFDKFKEILKKGKFVYSPYLGISEFIAETEFVDFIEKDKIEKLSDSSKPVEIATVVNIKQIPREGLIFEFSSRGMFQYVKERMPLEFNSERKLKSGASFIYEKNHNKVIAKIKGDYYKIKYHDPEKGDIIENIVFMEE